MKRRFGLSISDDEPVQVEAIAQPVEHSSRPIDSLRSDAAQIAAAYGLDTDPVHRLLVELILAQNQEREVVEAIGFHWLDLQHSNNSLIAVGTQLASSAPTLRKAMGHARAAVALFRKAGVHNLPVPADFLKDHDSLPPTKARQILSLCINAWARGGRVDPNPKAKALGTRISANEFGRFLLDASAAAGWSMNRELERSIAQAIKNRRQDKS